MDRRGWKEHERRATGYDRCPRSVIPGGENGPSTPIRKTIDHDMMLNLIPVRTAVCLAVSAAVLGIALECAADDSPTLFQRSCSACHGLDGKANTKMARRLGVKDLTQTKLTDADIEKTIRHGYTDTTGKSRMPAFGESLKDEEIKALVEAVKALQK